MGCCCSGHEEAKQSDLPGPMLGRDIKVKMKQQGMLGFDADFDVLDLTTKQDEEGTPEPVQWMLIDAVGSLFDSDYDYYLKYRPEGVDESHVLGCANLKKEDDYMYFQVTYSHQRYGRRPSSGRKRHRRWTDLEVCANWVICRRARLYSDKEQTQLIGLLQIAGQGTYRHTYHREDWEACVKTDDGHEWRHRSSTRDSEDTDIAQWYYKMDAYAQPFHIYFENEPGSWFTADKLTFTAYHAALGLPLFRVVSDGSSEAELQTFSNSDPVSSLLAAYAISIRLDPKEFKSNCEAYCKDNVSLYCPPGLVGGFGLYDAAYEATHPTCYAQCPPYGYTYGVPPPEEAAPPDGTAFAAAEGEVAMGAAPQWQPIEMPEISPEMAAYQGQLKAEGDGEDGGEEDGDDGDEGGDEEGNYAPNFAERV